MRRLLTPGFVVPILLALVGAALIIVGQLNLDQPTAVASLPPIPEPSGTPVASPSANVRGSAPPLASPTASPTPNPSWIAVQLQIASIGLNIRVHKASTKAQCDFPPEYDAWILCGGSEPGRGTNSYIFAHARVGMFLPLWNVQVGAPVQILMSDGRVLAYRVTEIHPNVSCPDSREKPMSYWTTPPLALQYADPGCSGGAFWTAPTDHERLTLQTSQGYNRNWGEFIVVAEPAA